MPLIEDEFGTALHGKVKRKRYSPGKLRTKAARVARGAAEVMVKITSYGKGGKRVHSHLSYITRHGQVELENERGEIFHGKAEVKALFEDWEQDFGIGKRRAVQRDTMHLVLSMPAGTPSEAVRNATRAFARQTFGKNHEYVFALHTDEPHPHCHVTVKMRGHDGKRLDPGRSDLASWRDDFAQTMRDEGVDAEATPRASRGVVRKAEKAVIRHIEHGDKTHQPRHSRARALQELAAIKAIQTEYAEGQGAASQPWESKIKHTQESIRTAWLAIAAQLDVSIKRPTIHHLENYNERPDYGKLDHERIARHHSTVALLQSDAAQARSKEPPRPLTSLRDLPGLDVVHVNRPAEMLLQPHARDRVGWSGEAGDALRRPRVGHLSALGTVGGLTHTASAIEADRALASQIREFVASMPALEPTIPTLHNVLKQNLLRHFSQTLAQTRSPQPVLEANKEPSIEPVQRAIHNEFPAER